MSLRFGTGPPGEIPREPEIEKVAAVVDVNHNTRERELGVVRENSNLFNYRSSSSWTLEVSLAAFLEAEAKASNAYGRF